jgi:glycosyltransferase involved in cell wall biosynthesis
MTDDDRVDTVTAVYAAVSPDHLAEALQSLVDQTLRPAQCVVVADGPLTPELDAVLARFATSLPLTVVRLGSHVGSGPAKQAGLEASTSAYVAIADADDISLPGRLEQQVGLLRRTHADLVGAAMEEFDTDTGETWGVRAFPVSHDEIVRLLRRVNPLNHPTVCLRRSTALAVGGYADLPYLEDYDLWARMVSRGARVGNCAEPLVRFRGGSASLARRRATGVTGSEWRLQRRLVSYGIVSWPRAVWNFATRTAFRLLPRRLMRGAYRRLFLAQGSAA